MMMIQAAYVLFYGNGCNLPKGDDSLNEEIISHTITYLLLSFLLTDPYVQV